MICELLGIPEEARANFADPDEFAGVVTDSIPYPRELLDQRRRHPSDDLLSALVAAPDGGTGY